MKTGIELITAERKEQLEKHGRSISQDAIYNSTIERPLTKAAACLSIDLGFESTVKFMRPENWDKEIWRKMTNKTYKERLIIAGALIAAEIDRIQYLEINKNEQASTL
jgi:hypothetical protein